jgi:hypothetical protein
MVRFSDEGSEERQSSLAKSGTRKLSSQPTRKEAAEGMKAVLGIAAQQSVSAKDKEVMEKRGLLNDSFDSPTGLKRETSALKREMSAQKSMGGRALGKTTTMAQREVRCKEKSIACSRRSWRTACELRFEAQPSSPMLKKHSPACWSPLEAHRESLSMLRVTHHHISFYAGFPREGSSDLPQI